MENKLWQYIVQVREESPLVYNICNYVVMNNTANALLAVGASPIMSHAHSEIEAMASISRALVVNIGTLDEYWVQSMIRASATFLQLQKPWILDPVGAGASPFRDDSLEKLLENKPTVIRGNASEIMALAKANTTLTKGVDSTTSSSNALEAAQSLADQTKAIVCISGETDYIVHNHSTTAIHNGHPLMTRVTGLGCTATALIGACVAIASDPYEATVAAVALLSIAGELAQVKASGPGTLQLHLLDILYQLDKKSFLSHLKLENI